MRNSAKLPRSTYVEVRELTPKQLPARRDVAIERAYVNPSQPEDEANNSDKPLDDEVEEIGGQIHPLTILRKGNSDPFQAFAIPIDARVAYMMTYTKDLYLPGVYRDGNSPEIRAAGAQEMAEMVSFLHDETTAYCHLARIVAAMPKSSTGPDFVSQSLIFKVKGVASLRKRLLNSDALKDPRTSTSILLFLTAELYEGNLEAAAFHAKMIAHLLQEGIIPVDFWFLFKVVYHDMQRACLALSRSAFDLETWVPQKFAPFYMMAMEKMQKEVLHEACEKLVDASVTDPTMKSLLTEAFHCGAVFMLSLRDQKFATRQIVFYLRCRVTVFMGRLINHYLDSIALMEKDEWWDVEALRAGRVQAYLSLAVVYMIRCRAKVDTFHIGDNVAIFSANSKILSRLRELLEQDQWNDEERYARMKLMALFVGAWAEQARAMPTSSPEIEWFNIKLAAQAAKMDLRSWREVREVLLGFNYSDSLQPHGSIWFGKTMSLNAAPRGTIEQAGRLLLE